MRWLIFWLLLPICATAQDRVNVGDVTYEVSGGKAFALTENGPVFVADLYDTDHVARSYVTEAGKTYRIDPDNDARYPAYTDFSEDFETTTDIADFMQPDTAWTAFTLQSRRAPTVRDYVSLSQQIARGDAECLDNCVSIVDDLAATGTQSLETFAVRPGWRNSVSKASLDTGLLYLRQGDAFAFSARFYIAEGMPVSLVDFEASYIFQGPGLRVMLTEDGVPWIELKWGHKPEWRPTQPVRVPQGAWFKLQFEAELDRNDGQVRLWLDDQLVVSGRGQTLPLADAVIDRMELGITAAVVGNTRLFIDDVHYTHLH